MTEPSGERGSDAPPVSGISVRPKRSARRSLVVLAVLLSVILVAVVSYAMSAYSALNGITRDSRMMPSNARPTSKARPSSASGPAPLNIVLMGIDAQGSDAQAGERGRSDTLMVAHINSSRTKIYLISFARDMYVNVPGHGNLKINAAYSFGGPALAVETLESLLDLRMDHAVKIEFEGFARLTDQLGGVTVFNPQASADGSYTFPAGEITIKGDQALAYVRERHDLPDGDLGRAARQRAVIKAIVLKLLRPEVIGNPVTFHELSAKLGKNVEVDPGLTNELLLRTLLELKGRTGADIVSLSAPILGLSSAYDDIDVVDFPQLAKLADALRDDKLDEYQATYGSAPDAVAVDSGAHEAYITHFDSGTVTVVDTRSGGLIATIRVGNGPEAVALDAARHTAYVTNALSGTVSVVDTRSHLQTGTIRVDQIPNRLSGLAIDPAAKKVYVGDQWGNSVSVIDTTTKTVTASIRTMYPWTIAVNPAEHTLYVTSKGSGSASMFDTRTRQLIGTIKAADAAVRMVPDPDRLLAYALDREQGTVAVIDPVTRSVTSTIKVGDWPEGVAVDWTKDRMYVANESSGTVSVIDTTTNQVVNTIAVAEKPVGLAVDPIAHTLVVTFIGKSTVSVINPG